MSPGSFFFVVKFNLIKIQIQNPNVFSSDDSTGHTVRSLAAGDSFDKKQRIIDSNIACLEESIRVLKSHRNDLPPISRLPVEILCNIFKLSLTESQPDSWTNFSQVSQHWRTSALGAPELWTSIPLNYPRWAQEMLIRSKMANLTIRFSPPPHKSNPKTFEIVRLCLYEIKRVAEMKFTAIPVSKLKKILRGLPKSAPQLHTLCLRPFYSGTAFSILDDFLCETERLQHVELINCKISWDSRLLTDLTCLRLHDSLKANSSIVQVLHALQRMPALTDLYLVDSIPDDSEGLSTQVVVDLPCLRVLDISSEVGALTAVLRHITFPSSATLNLTCTESQSTQIDFSNFLSVLAMKFLSTLVIRGLSLHVPLTNLTHNHLEHLSTIALISTSQMSQSQLQLVMKWPNSQPHNYLKTLTCAFDAMSLSFLTQLQISTYYIDSRTWVKTFGKLPLLERVCVQKYALPPFLEALVHKTKTAEESEAAYRNVSFPKLRYIHLEGIGFYKTLVDMLLDCLMERYERNAEVQLLRLDDCSDISSVEVERLKKVVVDVIWDGLEPCHDLDDLENCLVSDDE